MKIDLNEIEEFIRSETVLYASTRSKNGERLKFFISLDADEELRYLVKVGEKVNGFAKLEGAVEFFNENVDSTNMRVINC